MPEIPNADGSGREPTSSWFGSGVSGATDRPFLPHSFGLRQLRRHAHDVGAQRRRVTASDSPHHSACIREFVKLEGDGTGAAHETRPDLDQLELEAVSDQSADAKGRSIRRRKVSRL